MNYEERPLVTSSSKQRWALGQLLRWDALGIRNKILVPIIALMLGSLGVSTIVFMVSTNATRNSIISEQINDDSRRLQAAFAQSEQQAIEGAKLLASDPGLIELIQEEDMPDSGNLSLPMNARATPVRDRFELDQLIVLNAGGQARVNIGTTELEPISVRGREFLPICTETTQQIAILKAGRC